MTKTDLPTIDIDARKPSPTVTPQALAWDGKDLWMSSRDLGTLFKIDVDTWKVVDEIDPPGVVWGATLTNDGCGLPSAKG